MCRLGDHELSLPPKQRLNSYQPAPATAVCVTQCGNFAVVGSASGRLDRYNMQSGLHRGQYCRAAATMSGASMRCDIAYESEP